MKGRFSAETTDGFCNFVVIKLNPLHPSYAKSLVKAHILCDHTEVIVMQFFPKVGENEEV